MNEFTYAHLDAWVEKQFPDVHADDADLWSRNMEAIERCLSDNEPRLIASFDCLCSGYDDILSVEG